MSEPEVTPCGVRDVVFGTRVKIVEPCNLYGCEIGDDCFIGPSPRFRNRSDRGADARSVPRVHL